MFEEKENPLSNQHFQAQFTALKDQISPHFLFNSLSVLSSLVRKDADLAERFIDHLAKVYRYLLEYKEDEQIALSTELEFARSFAFLLEVRFARKFRILFPEMVSLPEVTLLPFTLQLLIDNAIRHNRMSAAEPLEIRISLESPDCLLVSSTLQPRAQPDNVQIGSPARGGLATIQQRYARLTGLPVVVEQKEGQFRVRIPFLKPTF
ncbi:sensor histidine kinase [Larkinella bovis]|uniref:Sensor histidine kinase n=1 Tax=Larkinella bovis TaxID=683041 RepID=A0ABW0ICE7_9BACT